MKSATFSSGSNPKLARASSGVCEIEYRSARGPSGMTRTLLRSEGCELGGGHLGEGDDRRGL